MSWPVATIPDTCRQPFPNPARLDTESVCRYSEALCQPPPGFDFHPKVAAIVFHDEFAPLWGESMYTDFQTSQKLLPILCFLAFRMRLAIGQRPLYGRQRVQVELALRRLPAILEKDEPRDGIAVLRRHSVTNLAFLRQPACDSGQRFIGQFVGGGTVLPLEIQNQPAADFEVPLSARINAIVQPIQELMKSVPGQGPIVMKSSRRWSIFHRFDQLTASANLQGIS